MNPARAQRGAATLLVVTLLAFVMLLAVAAGQRNAVVAETTSAQQYRAAQAFEAAEAGLEWATARLNDPQRIDARCRPSADPAATSFRERILRIADGSGAITPATWNDAGVPTALAAACRHDGAGWSCSCPANGAPALPAAGGSETAPAFSVAFSAGSRPGLVRAVSFGCTGASAACAAESSRWHETASRVEAQLALVPALRSAPAAALVARGDVDAGAATLALRNVDPRSGLVVVAGGRFVAGNAVVTPPPGSPLAGAVASADATLAAMGVERAFARHFGMDRASWRAMPGTARLTCAGDCTAQVRAAVAAGARSIAIDGDATLVGPAAFGSVDAPVAIVVAGDLRLDGDVSVDGVLYAASLRWHGGSAPAARIGGALVAGANVVADSGAEIGYDAAVLRRLKTHTGAFVRVNGSWKDF